jgi:hypothetical protein
MLRQSPMTIGSPARRLRRSPWPGAWQHVAPAEILVHAGQAAFPDAAREQFRSVDVDLAQCCFTRGQVHTTVGHADQALVAFEESIAVYDQAGYADAPPRFEAIRLAALVEGRGLDRSRAAQDRYTGAVMGRARGSELHQCEFVGTA